MLKWSTNKGSGAQMYDTDVMEKIDALLVEVYNDVMSQYWQFLSPDELKKTEESIKELKQKKVFQ